MWDHHVDRLVLGASDDLDHWWIDALMLSIRSTQARHPVARPRRGPERGPGSVPPLPGGARRHRDRGHRRRNAPGHGDHARWIILATDQENERANTIHRLGKVPPVG